jgi:hypothetical protein
VLIFCRVQCRGDLLIDIDGHDVIGRPVPEVCKYMYIHITCTAMMWLKACA